LGAGVVVRWDQFFRNLFFSPAFPALKGRVTNAAHQKADNWESAPGRILFKESAQPLAYGMSGKIDGHVIVGSLGHAAVALGMKLNAHGCGIYHHPQVTEVRIVVTFER
jgi:hypothetical protein